MLGRAKRVVGPAREQVTHVDHQRAFNRRNRDPLTLAVPHFEAGLVLPKQRQATVVGVRRHPELLGPHVRRLRRIVDAGAATDRAGGAPDECIRWEVHRGRERLHQRHRASRRRFIEAHECIAKRRVLWPGVVSDEAVGFDGWSVSGTVPHRGPRQTTP